MSDKRSAVSVGIFCVVLSSVFFAPLAQTATKYVATEFPLFQVMFFRSLGQTAWMLIFFWPKHGLSLFRTNAPGLQLARSALLFVSSMFWVAAIAHVPLATASAINFTAPIMVVLLSIPFLGEKVGLHRWGAVLLGFTGALIIVQPGADGVQTELIWLLIAAALFALYQILTRKVASRDHEATSAVYTLVVALIVSSVLMPFDYRPPESGDYVVWIAFAATGLIGGLRHFFVIRAYANAPASVISPFFYCELVGVALLGYFVFGDVPAPTALLGTLIIICSGLYIAHWERVRSRELPGSG
ncbi:MAG: DMT family transporter [Pseudomonadota bacterium]